MASKKTTKKSTRKTTSRTKKAPVKTAKKSDCSKLLKKHWKALTAAVIACVIAFICAITVFVWFVQTSDIGAQGTLTIDQWSLATVLWFLLNLILWELLFIGIPAAIIFGGGGYLWWSRLSPKDKQALKCKDDKCSNGNGGDAFEFFFFIAYLIYVAVNGNFYTPFGDLPYSYWLFAGLWTLFWLAIIIGIPAGIIGLAYMIWYKK